MTLRFSLPKLCLLVGFILAQLAIPALAAGEVWVYGVKPGDTLISVAAAYLIHPNDWPKLQILNRISNPKRLLPGSKLRLPLAWLKREAAIAEPIYIQGSVTRTPQNGVPQPLSMDMHPQMGDTIETGADASVSLRFVDGSRLLLTPNTRITLTQMVLFGKTGMAQTILDLHRGSIDTRVAKQEKPAARYEIKSRPLNLSVRGTDFRAHVDDTDQVSRSEVLGGAVQVSGARNKTVAVKAGFGTLAAEGEPPRAPITLLPAPDLTRVPALIERLPLRIDLPATAGVESYHAQVFSDRSFSHLLLDGIFKGKAAKWTDLPDGHYMLRVRGIDQNGLEGLNADREFVLKARPEPPFVSAPLDGQKSYGPEARLRWSTSMSARSYRVQVSENPDFSVLVADVSDLPKTEYAVTLAPGQYYWRIASIAAGQDQGPYSDVQGFTQRKIPESPKMDAPQMSDKSLTFRWSAGDQGSQYQLQLARDPEFAQPIFDKVLTTNQIQIDRPKPGTYYLRIKTIDADGFAGPFGSVQKLEVPGSKWWMLLLLVPLVPFAL